MTDSSTEYKSNKKTILKNTVYLFFRQLITLAINLYISRVVLNVIGVSDFGIYSVVGSFVAMFSVISGAFVVAITRYMALYLGKSDKKQLPILFSSSIWLQVLLGGAIFLLILLLGYIYVSYFMVYPIERINITRYVLLFSATSFFVGLLCVPFNALIVAHEKMKVFALISIGESFIKLFFALILPYIPFDKLFSYGAFCFCISLITFFSYFLYCKNKFEECSFSLKLDWKVLKDMMYFIQWAFLGNGAYVLREQGVSIIMNLFLGTGINAARGLSSSVNYAVTSFSSNFIQAVQPQITKLYSVGKLNDMCSLVCTSSRISYYLVLLIAVPLIKNIDYLLNLWLGTNIPEYTNWFISLVLIESLIHSASSPFVFGTLAEGKIKNYEIFLSLILVSILPISYTLLKNELNPIYIYVALIVIKAIIQIYLVWYGQNYGMKFYLYFSNVLKYILPVTILVVAFSYYVNFHFMNDFISLILNSFLTILFSLLVILRFGISDGERKKIQERIKGLFFN